MCPRRSFSSDAWCGGGEPGPSAQVPSGGEPRDVADLGHEDCGQHRADPGDGLDDVVAEAAGEVRCGLLLQHDDLPVAATSSTACTSSACRQPRAEWPSDQPPPLVRPKSSGPSTSPSPAASSTSSFQRRSRSPWSADRVVTRLRSPLGAVLPGQPLLPRQSCACYLRKSGTRSNGDYLHNNRRLQTSWHSARPPWSHDCDRRRRAKLSGC